MDEFFALKQGTSKIIASCIRNNVGILVILLLAALVRIAQYGIIPLWWDSAVYAEMGRHIFSLGQIGIWEDVRPLFMPILLGFFWRIGLNELLVGQIIMTLFSLGTILVCYLLADRLFGRAIALLASIMLAFTPTFVFFDSQLLSDLPSLFFALLGTYFFTVSDFKNLGQDIATSFSKALHKRLALAGFFFGLAFLTRFVYLGFFLTGFVALLLPQSVALFSRASYTGGKHTEKKNSGQLVDRSLIYYILAFALPVLPYIMSNYFLYHDFLVPFKRQVFMASYTGWIYWQPVWYYFWGIFHESVISIFSLFGLFLFFRDIKIGFSAQLDSCLDGRLKDGRLKKEGLLSSRFFLAALLLIYFAYYSSISHKELRFALTILPLIYIFSAFALHRLWLLFHGRPIANYFFIILAFIWVVQLLPNLRIQHPDKTELEVANIFSAYMQKSRLSPDDSIWISSPLMLLHLDLKADELIYYPLFNSNKIDSLMARLPNANLILVNQCDLACPPWDDKCPVRSGDFMSRIERDFDMHFLGNQAGCNLTAYSGKNQ